MAMLSMEFERKVAPTFLCDIFQFFVVFVQFVLQMFEKKMTISSIECGHRLLFVLFCFFFTIFEEKKMMRC